MSRPGARFSCFRPAMFICGDDAAARKTVATILDQFGWEPADMGGALAARAIEPRENKWSHAFKVLWKLAVSGER